MATRKATFLGIDPSMYRHFAAITIIVTLCIAFMGSSEQSHDEVMQSQKESETIQAKRAARQQAESRPWSDGQGSPGEETGPDLVAPINPLRSDGASGFTPPAPLPRPAKIVPRPRPKIDPKLLEHMTPEQRAAYLAEIEKREAKLEAEANDPAKLPTPTQISNLIAASRARSGTSSID